MIDPISNKIMQGAGQHGPVVLMYHSITTGNTTPQWPWAISFERFLTHLDLLQKFGWNTICMRDFLQPENIPPRAVAITFDDGYLDNLVAFEELARRKMSATCFVVSGDIGERSRWPEPGREPQTMLNAQHLKTMHDNGMEIGSHSRSHFHLTEVDDETLHSEVIHSKGDIEDILGQPVVSFAYPYGQENERVVNMVREAGYQVACNTSTGWALTGNDLMRMRRLTVYGKDSASILARKLAFGDIDVDWPRMLRYICRRVTNRFSRG